MSVRAGALEFPVRWAADGPWLEPEGEAAPLARAVNAWLRLRLDDNLEALRRGEEVRDDSYYARRPGEFDDRAAEAERWRRLAGWDAGEDAYLVGIAHETGELLVPRSALLYVLEELVALRDGDRPLLPEDARALEEQARALDELALTATTLQESARAHIRRGLVLGTLADAGLLSGTVAPPTRAVLDAEGCERLLGYVDAAAERARYAASEARRGVAEHVDAEPAVSLDWFRLHTPAPAGADPLTWLAGWEAIFCSGGPYEGPEGFSLVREHGVWHRLEWRRDDGERPLLLRVEPVADA